MSRTPKYSRTRALTVTLLTAAAGVTGAAWPVHAVTTPAGRYQLAGTHPAWAIPQADRGPAPQKSAVTARVYLASGNPAGLAAYARAVSDPSSRLYRRYLTPAGVSARFGASPASAAAVIDWLTRAGLRVSRPMPGQVDVTGTAAAAESAFGVSLHRYTVGGATYRAPAGNLTVPAALSRAVATVAGLSSVAGVGTAGAGAIVSPDLTAASTRGGSAATVNNTASKPEPCSDYWGQREATTLPPAYGRTAPYRVCGYTPAQLRRAYGVTGTHLTGKGTAVAVIDAYASPTMQADLNQYSVDMGDGPLRPGQYTEALPPSFSHVTDGLCGALPNWWQAESLAVEGVHAMAPGARITYVSSASCLDSDLIAAIDTVVQNRLASIVTIPWHLVLQASWGTRPSSDITAFEQGFEEGAAEGIGFYAAAGDCGDEDPALMCSANLQSTVRQAEYPASDPWVTAVGGTTLAAGPDGVYQWETSWSTIMSHELPDHTGWQIPSTYVVGGGGGGVSGYFTQPFYQRPVVPASLATRHPDGTVGAPMRVVPDVAMLGDYFNGMSFGETMPGANGVSAYTETESGGSGLSAALFAGVQADAEQAGHGAPIGFANPALYARYGSKDYHDITDNPLGPGVSIGAVVYNPAENAYAVDTVGQDGDLHATAGYDDATGLGSPAARYLGSYLWR